MNKKIMLLALSAVSAVVLALPAMASALEPLHLNPTPIGAQAIHGGEAVLSTSGSGTRVLCNGVSGSATFEEGGTTGSMHLTFEGNCRTSIGGTCSNVANKDSITTTTLPFHLATVGGKPGVLVTPGKDANGNSHFATFTCTVFGIPVKTEVRGNGVIGTITSPECGQSSTQATIDFSGASGIQSHTTVDGTETEYSLSKGSESAAQNAEATLTLSGESELVCS